jgi:hypothetical protein
MISALTGTNGPFLQIILFELHHIVIQRIPKQDIFEIMLWRRTHAATYSTHSLAVAGVCHVFRKKKKGGK